MQCHLRLIGLSSLARLRSAGAAPWLLFGGWMLAAGLQEPLSLRRYGIDILAEAAWIGGLALLLVLLLAESRLPQRAAWLANLAVLAAVSLIQAVMAMGLEFAATGESLRHVTRAACFFVAWAPLALTLAGRVGSHRGGGLHVTVVSCSLLLGCVHSLASFDGWSSQALLPQVFALVGAAVWAASSRRESP